MTEPTQEMIDQWKAQFKNVGLVEIGKSYGNPQKYYIRPDTRAEMNNSIVEIVKGLNERSLDPASLQTTFQNTYQQEKIKRCLLSPLYGTFQKKGYTDDQLILQINSISWEIPPNNGRDAMILPLIKVLYEGEDILRDYVLGVADGLGINLSTKVQEFGERELYITVLDGIVYIFEPLWEGDLERIEKSMIPEFESKKLPNNSIVYSTFYEEKVVEDRVVFPETMVKEEIKSGIVTLLFLLIQAVSDMEQDVNVVQL